ncbi:MAG: hypothetical protein P8129_00745 [Anaerolineae bacterium]
MDRNGRESEGRPDYLSYLLRLWRVTVAGQIVWRGSLECPHTGKRLGFANPESLWDFLRSEMDDPGTAPRPGLEEGGSRRREKGGDGGTAERGDLI